MKANRTAEEILGEVSLKYKTHLPEHSLERRIALEVADAFASQFKNEKVPWPNKTEIKKMIFDHQLKARGFATANSAKYAYEKYMKGFDILFSALDKDFKLVKK